MPELPPYGLILDILLVLAVAGLWLVWWRNLNRLHKTERLLAESIEQLETASSQLQQALQHIRAFEKERQATAERRPRPAVKIQTAAAEPTEDAILARTLRLERQGKSAEEIADILNVPTTQVRLMLKVHAPRGI